MKKNAAIYARVSSERQKEEKTIGSQTALLQEYARSHEYWVPPEWVFEDEGYSGGTLSRPALERLRDLVASGAVETVLIYAPDRLSRKYAYQVLLVEEFGRAGVQTHFLQGAGGDSPEDRLLVQFQGMIAEYERAQIAERTRRGKKHRARAGSINVLCGAPYGYRYIRKTEMSDAYYAVVESEAEIVREIFRLYAKELWSIGAIARELNARGVSTRFGKSPWERSTVWGMLKNPAYRGSACFGKTERAERQLTTRALRARGGFSARSSASRASDRQQWIAIPVPALVSGESFEMAQERLAENKRLSARRTKTPTLLQGILVCEQCGYSLYRTSTNTTRRQVQYYRCLGSDRYRHLRGPVCKCRPIRQDYLDELVWAEVIRLLNNPEMVQCEIERRKAEYLGSNPAQQRKERLEKEIKRVQLRLDKLLDAYQEELMGLEDLRRRVPELRRRQAALEKELRGVRLQAIENSRLIALGASMEHFLTKLKKSAQSLDVHSRQKIIRLIIKQIIVGEDTLKIEHCLPITSAPEDGSGGSYLLCTRSHRCPLWGASLLTSRRIAPAFPASPVAFLHWHL
jgi:site-specific DNA recombinase